MCWIDGIPLGYNGHTWLVNFDREQNIRFWHRADGHSDDWCEKKLNKYNMNKLSQLWQLSGTKVLTRCVCVSRIAMEVFFFCCEINMAQHRLE